MFASFLSSIPETKCQPDPVIDDPLERVCRLVADIMHLQDSARAVREAIPLAGLPVGQRTALAALLSAIELLAGPDVDTDDESDEEEQPPVETAWPMRLVSGPASNGPSLPPLFSQVRQGMSTPLEPPPLSRSASSFSPEVSNPSATPLLLRRK